MTGKTGKAETRRADADTVVLPIEGMSGIGVGTLLDGRYRVEEILATGGMGAVFRGRDTVLDRPVAVKSLHVHLASTPQAARFLQEGETLAALSHPNLVAVYDAGAEEGLPYLVMEFIEGESLASILNRESPLAPQQAVPIAVQVCNGLAYAHGEGVVHRDVKPQNLVVTPGGRVKIVDFGIARGPEALEMTEPGSVMGTAHYLAPEVAAGAPATASSDLYSLGVVLYRVFTGVLPFQGDDPVAVAVQHRTAPVTPVSQVRPGVPPAVARTVMRLLEKEPRRRYPNAAAVASALHQWPANEEAAHVTGPLSRSTPLIPAEGSRPAQARAAGWGIRKSDLVLVLVALASAALIVLRLAAPTAAGSAPPDAGEPPPTDATPAAGMSSSPPATPVAQMQPDRGRGDDDDDKRDKSRGRKKD